MFNLQNLLPTVILGLLSLPAILISLSVHETAHGYMAYKLGDPTAKNMGRLTLNPLKHINPIGFICMFLFRIGWANPVPVNSRYFKKPRRDMALTAAAGPISNLILAVIFTGLLRVVMLFIDNNYGSNFTVLGQSFLYDPAVLDDKLFTVLSVIAVMLYMGVILNISLMLFNLIPLPPLDGSRIAYVFLPPKWYFGIMRYEMYIMIGFLILLYTGVLTLPISFISNYIEEGLFLLTKMPKDLLAIVQTLLISRF